MCYAEQIHLNIETWHIQCLWYYMYTSHFSTIGNLQSQISRYVVTVDVLFFPLHCFLISCCQVMYGSLWANNVLKDSLNYFMHTLVVSGFIPA